jgi:uncharacterized protein (UPF0305 family)
LKRYLTEKINEIIRACKTSKSQFIQKVKNQKQLEERIKDFERIFAESEERLHEIDGLSKCLFEKYVKSIISEDKFFELDKSFDLEKNRLVKLARETESQIQETKKEASAIEAFYEIVNQYQETTEVNRDFLAHLVEKTVIHEEKNPFDKRIVDVYFVLVGQV